MYPPSGMRCTLRVECGVHSERGVIFVPPEACYSPRPKRVARPARSELLAPSEACCSPRPKRITRPARSVLLAPPEACCSPRPTFDLIFSITVLLNQFFSVAYTELVVKKADIIFNCVRTYKKLVANLTVGFSAARKSICILI